MSLWNGAGDEIQRWGEVRVGWVDPNHVVAPMRRHAAQGPFRKIAVRVDDANTRAALDQSSDQGLQQGGLAHARLAEDMNVSREGIRVEVARDFDAPVGEPLAEMNA